MYTLGVTGLVAAYVLVAVLLVSINLYSNWSWKVKATSIIITSIFYIITYFSYPPLLGWATNESPPERFRLIAAHVQQPDKVSGETGAIYLWLTELDDLTDDMPPRNYKLAYSNELHEKVINANAKLNKGIALLGEFEDELGTDIEVQDKSRMGLISTKIQFYDLPDPLFPDK